MAVSRKKKSRTQTAGAEAPPRRQRRRAQRSGGTFIGILVGMLLGAGAVGATASYVITRNSPFHVPETVVREDSRRTPLPLPGKPGDQPIVTQNFDSYRMSPVEDVPSPNRTSPPPRERDPVASSNPVAVPPPPEPVGAGGYAGSHGGGASQRDNVFYLQAGSFENPLEADNVKAVLAINGIEANVQRAQLGSGRIVHRVRIGPFDSQEEMTAVRSVVTAAGLDAIPVPASR